MKHPGYMLNPGDMFSVDPEQVLFATGTPKDYLERRAKIQHLLNKKPTDSESSPKPPAPESPPSTSTTETPPSAPSDSTTPASTPPKAESAEASEESKKDSDPLNPLDLKKPYLTPWRPRDFLSPFAFIPRYLEVNFNICHAVYLRHPVARPGASEVPSPFGPDTHQLAFHWFLRRR